MKKAFKIIGIVILVLLGSLLAIPYFCKDEIKNAVVEEVSNTLNAKLYLNDFSMGFFSNFPNATITLENVGIVGVDSFANDTLLNVDRLDAVINLASLFKDSYEINKIAILNPSVRAFVNADSMANWDIVKPDTSVVEEEEEASAPIKLNLNKFTIENLKVSYRSVPDSMFAAVKGLNLNLKGDIALDLEALANIEELKLIVDKIIYMDKPSSTRALLEKVDIDFTGKLDKVTKMKLLLGVDSVSYGQSGIPYLKKAQLKADIGMNVDLDSSKFTFAENYVQLNEIQAKFEGFVHLVDSLTTDMDVKLSTPAIDFKQILSLIPAIYSKEFESIQTSGNVSLNALAKGRLCGDTLPMIDATLKIADAMFKYPDLPSSMNNINIEANVKNPGGITDSTSVIVPKFGFTMAGNPFALTLGLKTPVSDPDFAVTADGTINLGSIKDVIYLDSMDLKGILTAALKANGRMSYIDQKLYEKCAVNGDLKLNDFVLQMPSLDYDVKVNEAQLGFTTQNVGLKANLAIGKSDFLLNGSLQNFIQYVMRGETIAGNLSVKSNLIDTNELLGTSEDADVKEEEVKTDTASAVVIPNNINFNLDLAVDQLKYGAINLNKLVGRVGVNNSIAQIHSLTANTMGGNVAVAGSYNTKDTLNPIVDVNMIVKNMSISEVFTKVKTAKKLVPLLSDAEGNFSMNMDFVSKMDETLSPILNTINAKGKFNTQAVTLKNTEVFNKIADKVNMKELKNPKLKNLNISFTIKDGRLMTNPFETSVSSAILNVSGSSGLDQTLDFVSTIKVPKGISNTVDMAFDVLIGGTFKQPKVSFSVASMVEQVKEKVIEKVDEAKQKAIAEAKAQKEKLVAVAKTEKEKLVTAARASADKVLAKAQAQSDSLMAKANNPLAKAAAKKTSDAVMAKAKTQANKIVSDAESKGDKLVSEAEKKGDKLISDAEQKSDAAIQKASDAKVPGSKN